MSLQYKKVLIIGGTSGIGKALAERFVQTGTSVIVVGRRKEQMIEFAKRYSTSEISVDTASLDVTDLKAIPQFAADIFTKHPDIDSVWLNSGIQRAINWTNPDSVDLDVLDTEVLTNYTSYMHLTKAFLPYLQKQAPKKTSLIFTTSGLALIPALFCPNYCATKAAMHHMVLLNVKIIELLPPAVQTELHDHESGVEKGRGIGMPLKDFTDEAFEGLIKSGSENEQVPVQAVKSFMGFDGWEQERQKTMHKMIDMMKKQSH